MSATVKLRQQPIADVSGALDAQLRPGGCTGVDGMAAYEYNSEVSGSPLEELIPYHALTHYAEKPMLIRGSFAADKVSPRLDYLCVMVSSPARRRQEVAVRG